MIFFPTDVKAIHILLGEERKVGFIKESQSILIQNFLCVHVYVKEVGGIYSKLQTKPLSSAFFVCILLQLNINYVQHKMNINGQFVHELCSQIYIFTGLYLYCTTSIIIIIRLIKYISLRL